MLTGMLIGAGNGAAEFCTQTGSIWKIVGYIVLVIKIVIPILLIIFGMLDLGKAVIQSDEKAIGKAVGSLIRRFIAAVIVFFIPTIVSAIFGILGVTSTEGDSNWSNCINCITSPTSDKCTTEQGIINVG